MQYLELKFNRFLITFLCLWGLIGISNYLLASEDKSTQHSSKKRKMETEFSSSFSSSSLSSSSSSSSSGEAPADSSLGSLGSNANYVYDEYYDSQGVVRDEYKYVDAVLKIHNVGEMNYLAAKMNDDFKSKIYPIPRIMSKSDFSYFSKGVFQRARLYQEFLKDHFSRESDAKSYLQVIPKKVINRILNRSGLWGAEKYVTLDKISFVMGMDNVRTGKLSFKTLEVNTSFVGGIGDMIKIRDIMKKRIPAFQRIIDLSSDPLSFYQQLVVECNKRKVGQGKVVMVAYPKSYNADSEDQYMVDTFKKLGIETVYWRPWKANDQRFDGNLVVRQDGVYYVSKNHSEKNGKVGLIINSIEWHNLDPAHPMATPKFMLDLLSREKDSLEEYLKKDLRFKEILANLHNQKYKISFSEQQDLEAYHPMSSSKVARLQSRLKICTNLLTPDAESGEYKFKEIEKYLKRYLPRYEELLVASGFPGLLNAFYSGKVGLLNSPGAEIVDDKEFYIYEEKLLRHYFPNEEPIIRNLITENFYNNKQLFEMVFGNNGQNKDKWVIKKVDGSGGDSVWVGHYIEDLTTFFSLKEMVLKAPAFYVAQEYVNLSQMDGMIGDYRLFSFILDQNPSSIIICDTPWARISAAKDGKVNICQNGAEQVVLVIKDSDITKLNAQFGLNASSQRSSASSAASSSLATYSSDEIGPKLKKLKPESKITSIPSIMQTRWSTTNNNASVAQETIFAPYVVRGLNNSSSSTNNTSSSTAKSSSSI